MITVFDNVSAEDVNNILAEIRLSNREVVGITTTLSQKSFIITANDDVITPVGEYVFLHAKSSDILLAEINKKISTGYKLSSPITAWKNSTVSVFTYMKL